MFQPLEYMDLKMFCCVILGPVVIQLCFDDILRMDVKSE